MRKRLISLIAGLLALGMFATPSAQAVDPGAAAGVAVFAGKATLDAELCYPLPITACAPTDGKVGFTFAAGEKKPHGKPVPTPPSECVGIALSPKKSPLPVGPLCNINASGDVNADIVAPSPTKACGAKGCKTGTELIPGGPFCGYSNGSGVSGTVTYSKIKTYSFSGGYWSNAIGGTIVIVAKISKAGKPGLISPQGKLIAVLNAFPKAEKGESCLTGADEFDVIGFSMAYGA